MMKIALLSRWHVHADDYAEEALANPNIQVHTLWDEDEVRGLNWSREINVAFEKSLDKLLADDEIEGVIITTATSAHYDIIKRSIKAGKHVFSEKILAETVDQCKELYRLAEVFKVHLMLSLPRLGEREFLLVKSVVDKGWLGTVTNIRCRVTHDGLVDGQAWLPERFLNEAEARGGALIDLGAHPIYLVNRLAGQIEAVYSTFQMSEYKGVDLNATVTVDYASGITGVIETSFTNYKSLFELEVYGSHGFISILNDHIHFESEAVGPNELDDLTIDQELLASPMTQWLNQIKAGLSPNISKKDVINLTKVNQAAAQSYQQGKKIKLSENY